MNKLDQQISAVLERVAQREQMPEFTMPEADSIKEEAGRLTRKRHWFRWTSMSIATAGAILFLVGVGTYVSPEFASQVKGVLGQSGGNTEPGKEAQVPAEISPVSPSDAADFFPPGEVDGGIEKAVKDGFVQVVNASVADQGITFWVKAIMADPTRVVVAYQITGPDGKPLKREKQENLVAELVGSIRLVNELGEGIMNHPRPTATARAAGKQGPDIGFLDFSDLDGEETEQMKLLVDISTLGNVEGKWKLEVPFSLKKAMEATKTIPINKEYVTPQGLKIILHEVTQAPSSTVLKWETMWEEQAKKRLEQYAKEMSGKTQNKRYASDPFQHYDVELRILDRNGMDVGVSQREAEMGRRGHLDDYNLGRDEFGHFIRNSRYTPFGDQGPYTFVLDAVTMVEPVSLTIPFEPAKLQNSPKQAEYEGSLFTVKQLKEGDEGDRRARKKLELEASLQDISSIEHVWWELKDQNGKSYPIRGSSYTWNGEDEQGRSLVQMELKLEEMEEIPTQLTLSLAAVNKRYPDGKWKVELPKKFPSTVKP
ncbi:DUF4179 domain-containing protein [Brevibacillus ruminantium]|uniref:DUF4179 domain-containing protein n=1 Tax=Brevibacillus ruminantium TaxID=2950604 RepID=A0ABY4WDM7_9BACL|nr:DUF4179 domain-containing protein [Brevibacillus ruminantium]USG65280.1 DUF4179 domain-containing protein [Brevibacillus ruminantium]